VNPRQFRDICAERVCRRLPQVPAENLGIVVKALSFSLFRWIYRDFDINPKATKFSALGAKAKSLLGKRYTNSCKNGVVIVQEERSARIDQGTALHKVCAFQEVNAKRGFCCSKKIKGNDFAVVYKLTATWRLKVNRISRRVVEECTLRFSTVNVLSGRTVAWSNQQRVGEKGCLTQEERDTIAGIVIFYPKKANFHLLESGSPEQKNIRELGTSSDMCCVRVNVNVLRILYALHLCTAL
jgi:hypothetical protein